MKYVRFTRSRELNIFMTIVWVAISIGILAYGAGFMAGIIKGCFDNFL